MKVAEFLNLNHLKKINNELNEYIKSQDYGEGKLLLKWQGFVENQHVGCGRNGASTLVDLQTVIYECKDINFGRPFGSKSSYMKIYVNASATAGQGGRSRFKRLRMRDLKSKKIHTMEDVSVESLISRFGRIWEEPSTVESGNVVALFKQEQEVELSEKVYEDFIFRLNYDCPDKVAAFLQERGFEFLDIMEYSHSFDIHPEAIKMSGNKIEIAFKTNATYNSLPEVISIEKVGEFKTISLASLDVETPGYYSHHDRMEILPEQKAEVLKFKEKFDKLMK